MGKWDKIYEKVNDPRGTFDHNIRYEDLGGLTFRMGCSARKTGGHLPITYQGSPVTNIQVEGKGMAKPYQVRQVRDAIKKFNLKLK